MEVIKETINTYVEMMVKYYPYFWEGVKNTVILSAIATFFGFILGMILALFRICQSKNIFLLLGRSLAGAYIELIRGTPLLVQLLLVYSSTESMTKYMAGLIALSINSSAYVAEIIRAGIQSVDKGQMEAARSLGMPMKMTYQEIILPQAIKNILPALGNEFIVLIKETAIVSVVGIADLLYNVSIVQSQLYKPKPPLIVAAALYLILTLTLSKVMQGAERRLKQGDRQ